MKQPLLTGFILTVIVVAIFGLAFATLPGARADPDSDGDGVPDNKDDCPGFNDAVDIDGDGIPNGCDANDNDGPFGDMDGDGFVNQNDFCPTVFGAARQGCPQNYAPTIDAISEQRVNEMELLLFNIQARDRNGDALTLSLTNAPAGASLRDYGYGLATFRWEPSFDDAGDQQITVTASDGELQTSATITIIVQNVNRAPQLKNIERPFEVHPGEALGFKIEATEPDRERVTFTLENFPAEADLWDNLDNSAMIKWTPTEQDVGLHQFRVTASDGSLQDTMTIMIRVLAPGGTPPGDNNGGNAGNGNNGGGETPNNNPPPANDSNPALSAEEQRYQDLRHTYEQLRDDYSSAKRKYDRATAEHNQRDITKYGDDLDNTDKDLSNLADDVDSLRDDVDGNDALENQRALLSDVDALKHDIQNLKDRIRSLLRGPSEPAAASRTSSAPAPARNLAPQIRVEPLAFPPEALAPEAAVNSWERIRPLVWMGAGSVTLLAIVIFLAALLFL